MSSLRENYFNIPIEAWLKPVWVKTNLTVSSLQFKCSSKTYRDREYIRLQGSQTDGIIKFVDAVANDFLPSVDLRESASVARQASYHGAYGVNYYRLLWELYIGFCGIK